MNVSTKPLMNAQRLGLAAIVCALAACSQAPVKPDAPETAPPAPTTAAPDSRGDPQQRFDAALEQMKGGDLKSAEQGLAALSRDFPEYSGPWTNLGILYAKSKRRDAAINALGRAVQIDPGNVVAFNWLGIINREAGRYDQAQLAYEQGLKAKPSDTLTRLNYAILLDQYLKQPQAAIAQYKQYQTQAAKEDLRVMAWIAELEAMSSPRPAAGAASTPPSGRTP